jgi:hypothetical protein
MAWEGEEKVTGFAGGTHGPLVKLGDAVVPPKARMTFEGVKGTPNVVMNFEIRDGRPECVSVNVTAKPEGQGRGIQSADMQMFNIDTLAVSVFGQLANLGSKDRSLLERGVRSVYEARTSRRGSRITREDLEEVARVYREHVDESPTQAVGIILGLTERTAARRVQQARAAGLLPKTTPGKRRA